MFEKHENAIGTLSYLFKCSCIKGHALFYRLVDTIKYIEQGIKSKARTIKIYCDTS